MLHFILHNWKKVCSRLFIYVLPTENNEILNDNLFKEYIKLVVFINLEYML